ncbi:hypothetical protein FJY93_00815 [Candidatus Kaiserbacteria bacterium]|nr:hypothetical protein [Candidatus Kaiserbacteria bacterium]
MRKLMLGLVACLALAGVAAAQSQLTEGMTELRASIKHLALARTTNDRGELTDRMWRMVIHRGVEIQFQELGYQGCAFVHMEKTGYVPVCVNYREDIYARLVSGEVEKIDEAITLIEIRAMQMGLIPYEESDVNEQEEL